MRTLIVDDEHFVRKGLILTVPWMEHGFEIVGEAENGIKALKQLESQPIDVLITDLTMPQMSGFELMKEVQQRYPDIWIVVLTCHQDFQFAIEAMQYGAIDYLVKTQIEEGKMEEALDRIEKRINEASKRRLQPIIEEKEQHILELVLVPAAANKHPEQLRWSSSLKPVCIPMDQGCFRLTEHGLSTWQQLHKVWESERYYEDWIPVVCESNDAKGSYPSKEWIMPIKEQVFYAYRADHPSPVIWHTVNASATSKASKEKEQAAMDKIGRMFHSLHWIYDAGLFHTWTQLVEESRPSSALVSRMVVQFLKAMSNMKAAPQWIRVHPHARSEEATCWHELLSALTELRAYLQQREFPEETSIGIYKAILLIENELSENLNQENVAQRVALSRSYFGQCFRPIVGMSFHELLTEVRIRKAEELLIGTNDYIYSVAEQAGFQDEKYFSKVFKQHRQMLPKEYRELNRNSPT
ncbi:response regulator transcription factor [Paenibacillus sp. YIM B09110]|uniref:response regulator transcription factor n=1 Tax=Paenibacillus sp. YIM B09110 TaxID=3126102 RepID=UPI00301C1734